MQKNQKKHFFKKISKKTLIFYGGSGIITSSYKKKFLILKKSLGIRILKINFYMIGQKTGRYLSNRKLYNRPLKHIKRR